MNEVSARRRVWTRRHDRPPGRGGRHWGGIPSLDLTSRSFYRGSTVRLLRVVASALALLGASGLAALPADRAVSQYVRRAWTVEQGLPHGTIRGFAQTADGYLCVAAYEGLVRFNGEKFR